MEWSEQWQGPFGAYVGRFRSLIGDRRTAVTFSEVLRGILTSGSLVRRRIGGQAPILSRAKDPAQRVIRMAKGTSTRRSDLQAESLIERLRQEGSKRLESVDADGVWLIMDGSDLRKPHAGQMESLMTVKDLEGRWVPGYRTLNVLASTPGCRALVYHRLFSTKEKDFVSEPQETQAALSTVSQALIAVKSRLPATWILDRGFDDVAAWRTIWSQGEHLVCRVKHEDRLVRFRDQAGDWHEGHLYEAREHLVRLAAVEAEMRLRRGNQRRPQLQRVDVQVWACALSLRYDKQVRRPAAAEPAEQDLWLVEIRVPGTDMAPWRLITDWPVDSAERARMAFAMYAHRWAIEDAFKVTKQCLGWEDIQLLDLNAVRNLVAMAWVAAGFLYELGVTLADPDLRLLARLGAWEERKDRPPGKIVLTRGLRRLFDMYATQAALDAYVAKYGALPQGILALLGRAAVRPEL